MTVRPGSERGARVTRQRYRSRPPRRSRPYSRTGALPDATFRRRLSLRIPADEQPAARGEQDDRPQAEDSESLPGGEDVGGLLAGLRDQLAGDVRQVAVDVVGDRAGDQRDQ